MKVSIRKITTRWSTAMMFIKYLLFWLMLAGIVTASTFLGILLSIIWLHNAVTSYGVDIFSVLK